ncbi:hypothetical protein ABEB36_003701 [Hypothenemus hampei]|uniref:Molybdenum cofactor sulfurase n=1 Tax=Hypothenemus hampei TaxID=57062 RepID=A0ABD1F183_HYPHA
MKKRSVYSREQEKYIQSEFSRLKGTFYMDHAGAALYSDKQMENVLLDLQRNIYSNPHAHNTSSNNTQDAIDLIRFKVLSFFNTTQEEYSVIFTSGATHALKLVAESFNFNGGTLVYLEDNHTSVLGMRKLVDKFRELKVADAFNLLSSKRRLMKSSSGNGENCLFVYPAESNFAGTKFPLSWIESVKKMYLKDPASKWYTLLDATCFVATNQLDLNQYKPDFVTISFYKIFGYPTGLGALIVKRSSEEVLRKKYLGGGTVLMALSSQNVMIPRPNIHERFEDGTINFLSIISLTHGFETLCRLQLNPNLISRHTFNIAKYIHENLSELRHSNGKSVAVLYGDSKFESIENQGGIINFNLKRPNGDYVGFAEVLHIANLHKIYLRTGCFCNPGACQKFLQLSAEDVKTHYEAGHVCGDQNDLVNGYPTGSVRISFGYMSTYEDADTFISMIHSCFVSKSLFTENISLKSGNVLINQTSTTPYTEITGRLVKVFLYPVKSCAAFEVKNMWKLTKLGLKYDRRWMIVNASGSCVSQKQIKSLCTLKPTLDFTVNKLRLTVKDSEIEVPLEVTEETSNEGYICNSKVCGDRIQGIDCGTKVAEWLSEKFNNPGLRLLRQIEFTHNTSGRSSKEGKKILSLANNAEYLLINLSTVQWLRDRIPREDIIHHSIESILLRFRANFIVDFAKPFVENDLAILCFNDVSFNAIFGAMHEMSDDLHRSGNG